MKHRVADSGKRPHEGGLDARDGRGVEAGILSVLLLHGEDDAERQAAHIRGHVEVLAHVAGIGLDTFLLVVGVDLLEGGDHRVGEARVHLAGIVVHAVEVDIAAVDLTKVGIGELAGRGLIRTHCHHPYPQSKRQKSSHRGQR